MGVTIAQRLAKNEEIIADAEYGFVAKGAALAEIRDKVQFQRGSSVEGQSKMTFEDYCATRWDWSRRYADRLIAAARVANIAEQAGVRLGNEGQAREVADLFDQPEVLTEILLAAQERAGGRVTAAAIRAYRHSLNAVEASAGSNGDNASSESDETGVQKTVGEDETEGEDWPGVIRAFKTQLRKAVRECSPDYSQAFFEVLEDVTSQARKKAIQATREK